MPFTKETRAPMEDVRLLASLLDQPLSPDELLVDELLARPLCGHHAYTPLARRAHHALRVVSVSCVVAGALALAVPSSALTPRAAYAQPITRAPAQQVGVAVSETQDLALLAALLSSSNLHQGVAATQQTTTNQTLADSQLTISTALVIPAAPAAVVSATTAQLEPIYTVQPDDTLSRIALRYYGDGNLWYGIYQANTNVVENPHWIYPGERLAIPSTGGVVPPPSPAGYTGQGIGNHTVVSGDTLSGIAYQAYGDANRWETILSGQHQHYWRSEYDLSWANVGDTEVDTRFRCSPTWATTSLRRRALFA